MTEVVQAWPISLGIALVVGLSDAIINRTVQGSHKRNPLLRFVCIIFATGLVAHAGLNGIVVNWTRWRSNASIEPIGILVLRCASLRIGVSVLVHFVPPKIRWPLSVQQGHPCPYTRLPRVLDDGKIATLQVYIGACYLAHAFVAWVDLARNGLSIVHSIAVWALFWAIERWEAEGRYLRRLKGGIPLSHVYTLAFTFLLSALIICAILSRIPGYLAIFVGIPWFMVMCGGSVYMFLLTIKVRSLAKHHAKD